MMTDGQVSNDWRRWGAYISGSFSNSSGVLWENLMNMMVSVWAWSDIASFDPAWCNV